ncbi:MAG TPA: alpha/beta fold hydrolase [Candidatus Acidoferrales bacterium]|nr:alpha/beta fold hydrolase [Candidatus Acidoferrales bacterium]
MNRCAAFFISTLLFAPALTAQSEPNIQRNAAHLGPNMTNCTAGSKKVPAQCGTFTVYEDRAAASGRTVAIPLVVIPAEHPTHRAIFWNPGGPGGGAVDAADDIADGSTAKELMNLHAHYDIVLANNRGVGGPDAQHCDLSPSAHPEYYFMQIWPDALLKACRDRLAANANLSLYTSSISADDLDDIRAALGYPKIVLDGGSYGSYFFFVYMRQHPEHVESAVFQGVAPPAFLKIPLEDAAGSELAMEQLITACQQDAQCEAHFPKFKEHFAAVAHRFDGGPVKVRIENAATKQPQDVLLAKEVFADRLRQALYTSGPAAYVPFIIERAYLGDYVPLGRMIETVTQGLGNALDLGLNLSVTCAEDIPFITEDAVCRTSAGSFEGDVRVRAQQRACKIWNVQPVPDSFNQPVRGSAPVLMISGTNDPATPPEYAARELRYLPNGRQILVKGASHGDDTPCTDRLKVEFVLAGSARHLNGASCTASFHRPPFVTSMAEFSKAFQ